MFVLDPPTPHPSLLEFTEAKTFEEPIIMLQYKKVLVIFPKTDGEGILKKADLTHSSCSETHPQYLLPLLLLTNPCIEEMICARIYLPAFLLSLSGLQIIPCELSSI